MHSRRKGTEGEDRPRPGFHRRMDNQERNFRTRRGEIDIIAEQGSRVAFIEVKAWDIFPRASWSTPSTRASASGLRRLPACIWRATRGIADRRLQFDVIFLGAGAGEVLVRLEGAFSGGAD